MDTVYARLYSRNLCYGIIVSGRRTGGITVGGKIPDGVIGRWCTRGLLGQARQCYTCRVKNHDANDLAQYIII